MFSILRHWHANGLIAYRRHQAREMFYKLGDPQLRDMGLERFAIEDYVVASLPWQTLQDAPTPQIQPSLLGCG